jgi:tRNA(adenine34) deaminase
MEKDLDQDRHFMGEAIRQAQIAARQDEVPIGAVITCKNQIVAKAYNQVELLKDPTAHAEMIAITQATHTLGCKWLQECCLYVTIEPCAMCAGALVLARLRRICFGATDPKAGACGSVVNIASNKNLNHRVVIKSGIAADDCGQLLSDFFRKKRLQGKK